MEKNIDPYVEYAINISELRLTLASGVICPIPEVLSNGRVGYVLFETLIRFATGLKKGNDHIDSDGNRYEQKAYGDPLNPNLKSKKKLDLFQASASSTFSANNKGPEIKRLLSLGKYPQALEICKETGYNKNNFYIFTNTRNYNLEIPFKYTIIPTIAVLKCLSSDDPREVSLKKINALVEKKITISSYWGSSHPTP